MITKNDVSKVYDTILSTPGMNEMMKIDLKISRKNVLLLSHLIDQGVIQDKEDSILLKNISEQGFSDLKSFSDECLQKAGLVELNQKLLSLGESIK